MNKKIWTVLAILLVVIALLPTPIVFAQDEADDPVYIVQSGDTLSVIAVRFGVSVDEIISANSLSDPNALSEGMQLKIPGMPGIKGILVSQVVPLGETLSSLALRGSGDQSALIKLNRITSPDEIYAGINLLVPQVAEENQLVPVTSVQNNQSSLELAMAHAQNPWSLRLRNGHGNSWDILADQTLYLPKASGEVAYSPISDLVESIELSPLPLAQGQTTRVTIKTRQPVDWTGMIADRRLNFFPFGENTAVAYVGFHARALTGLTSITLQGKSGDRTINFQQSILINTGNFGEMQYLEVSQDLIDEETIKAEEAQLLPITTQISPDRFFDETFLPPLDSPCINGLFGVGRIYNGTYEYFHNGLDFSVCADNLNIYSVAPGTVVFSGALPIKGNYTIIDHGWGVFSAYAHQNVVYVTVGDRVDAHQLIGEVGNTGRSVGPHLHFEVWVDGVQVDPLGWLSFQ